MKRLEKESFVSRVKADLSSASVVIALDRSFGITVEEITQLRKNMNDVDSNLKVLKNTLAKIAMRDSSLEQLSDSLKGPTALAYSNNPVGMSKALSNFVKKNDKMKILGGVMDGKYISAAVVVELASLPSVDELRAKIIGLLTASATKIVRTIKEPAAMIARVVSAKN